MTDLWREMISRAERALRGDATARARLADAAEVLRKDPRPLDHATLGKDLARLTTLFDALGLYGASRALLEHVVSRLVWDPEGLALDVSVRNQLAVVLADRGHLSAAANVLAGTVEFGARQGDVPAMARTYANLAAIKFRLGDVEGAVTAARRAEAALAARGEAAEDLAEVRLLVASVLTSAARRKNHHAEADLLLEGLEGSVRHLVKVLGGEHPQSLSALVTLASAEFESASAAGSPERMERAVDVLAVAAQRASATMGAHHPQAISALSSLATAEAEAARATGDERRATAAESMLAAAQHAAAHRQGSTRPPSSRPPASRPPSSRPQEPRVPPRRMPSAGSTAEQRPRGEPGDWAESTATLRFRVLGPVRAWRGSEPLSTGSPQQRALLAALLLHGGHTATAPELVEALWGEEPPDAAIAALRTYASRLRKAFGPNADVLASESGGYALRVVPASFDLSVAEDLALRAEREKAAGEARQARELLGRALALWEGETLAGIPGPFAENQRLRLEEWRLQLLETRLGLDLELGHHAEAVSELTALTAAHPLRERLRELLMLALYRSGRQAEALAVYADTRRLLADELGLDPRPELSRLQQRILRADAELARTVEESAPATATIARPAQLPATVPDFTGRASFVRELVDQLAGPEGRIVRVSAIAGIDGVGKTTLAVHAASEARPHFPDGQLYVDLQSSGPRAAEPEAVLGAFLRALGTPDSAIPDTLDERAALYRSALDDRRVLVLLDNARDAGQVRPLIPSAPGCAALITSRARMTNLAGAHLVDLDVMAPEEALQFFTKIVGQERVSTEREAALDVVAACGFLPLAIRIAASRLVSRRIWTVSVLAAKLADERRRLDELQAGDLAVKATFELGYGQLSPQQARAFCLLGLADGQDISLAAAAAMLDQPSEETEDVLESLVDTSLLESAGPGRYRYHDLARLYARDRAELDERAPGEREAALSRLLDFYLATATQAYAAEHPGDRSVAHLEPTRYSGVEFSYLDDARRWLGSEAQCILSCARQLTHGTHLRRSIDLLWSVKDIVGSSNPRQYQETAEAAKRAAHGARDGQAEGRACAALSAVHLTAGNLEQADAEARRALALAVAIDDPVTGAWAPYDRGVIALQQGRHTEADRYLREALSRFRADDNPFGVANALCQLSHLETSLGNVRSAVALAEEAIDRLGEEPATLALAECRYALGLALLRTERTDEALAQLDQALEIFQDGGQALGEGMVHFHRAQILLTAHRPAQAAAEAEQALAVLHRVGGDRRRADVLLVLGHAMDGMGESARARTCWAEALALYEDVPGEESAELREHLRARLDNRTAHDGTSHLTGT